ncbi:MAG: histidinol-phosphatase [Defluviitaleaceae bacterium]|nr:histidinol-phosphatase [Defluviitaleaceae bacterium]
MEYLYETHVHTSESSRCGQNSAVAQVRAYKKRGYTGIIITDHFIHGYRKHLYLPWKIKMKHVASGYEAAKKEGIKCGLDVFFGWEFTVDGSDFLTYGLDLDFLFEHTHLAKLSLPEYSNLIRKSGGYIAQAHPYRDKAGKGNKFPVNPEFLDGLEVYNAWDARNNKNANEKAFAFAQKHNLPIQAGSDSHGINIPIVSGIKLKKKADSILDIIEEVKAKKVELILP